jgi:uncharacterized membrane protein YoaT (DUF817 family)
MFEREATFDVPRPTAFASLRELSVSAVYCGAFPMFVLGTLAATKFIGTGLVPRYDAVLFACIACQIAMLLFRIETPREFATIFIFHAMGTALEIFKVNHGGWYYPEPSWIKVAGVPLYSGFMYASVGSFILACWKRFDVRLDGFPDVRWVALLVLAVYANFFTNYWWPDLKPVLLLTAIALFLRTRIAGRVATREIAVPLPLVFVVLGPIVWCAENVGTWLGSWEYPRQAGGWVAVPPDKLLSWTVLVMVSFLVVALVRRDTIESQAEDAA